jgi:hypothetical protein
MYAVRGTKGGTMFLLINYAPGDEGEGESKASLYTLLSVSSEQQSGQLISGDVRRPLSIKLYGHRYPGWPSWIIGKISVPAKK